jgi:hypothetical protein
MRPAKLLMFATMSIFVWIWLVGLFAPSVIADNTLARFEGGIGVIPVRAGPAANTVRGINPGGQPWVIRGLSADITMDGQIEAVGEGVLLGGGDNIGTNGGQSVGATLFCANDGNVQHKSGAVPLEPNGDFRIDSILSPAPPNPCENPVLLIRGGAGDGNWFAAGIPKLD